MKPLGRRNNDKNKIIQIIFVIFLTLILSISLINYIRHQKYQLYLHKLNKRNQSLAGPSPAVRARSKKIFKAFKEKQFDTLKVLVEEEDKEENELKKALYDYTLAARPHLIDHIMSSGCSQSLEILLKTEAVDPNNLNLLHTAITDIKGHPSHDHFIETLLNFGTDPDLADNKGNPPIAHAIIYNNPAAVTLLIKHGAKLNVAFHKNDSFLHFAVSRTKPPLEIIKSLLLANANPFHRGSDGLTPIHFAILKHSSRLSLIKVFLNNIPSAFTTSNTRYLDTLLNYPSEPTLENVKSPADHTRYGFSPLHWAVMSCKVELVKLLLERGANYNQIDSDGVTPLKLAQSLRHQEVIDLFTITNQQ